jgi:hypothetical protein
MGGYGSGKVGWRTTVESCLTLDAGRLKRDGLLVGPPCRGGVVSAG